MILYYIEETQMHRQIIYHMYLLWNNLPVFIMNDSKAY